MDLLWGVAPGYVSPHSSEAVWDVGRGNRGGARTPGKASAAALPGEVGSRHLAPVSYLLPQVQPFLPTWLAEPSCVGKNVTEDLVPIEDIPEVHPDLQRKLRAHGISSYFPGAPASGRGPGFFGAMRGLGGQPHTHAASGAPLGEHSSLRSRVGPGPCADGLLLHEPDRPSSPTQSRRRSFLLSWRVRPKGSSWAEAATGPGTSVFLPRRAVGRPWPSSSPWCR